MQRRALAGLYSPYPRQMARLTLNFTLKVLSTHQDEPALITILLYLGVQICAILWYPGYIRLCLSSFDCALK